MRVLGRCGGAGGEVQPARGVAAERRHAATIRRLVQATPRLAAASPRRTPPHAAAHSVPRESSPPLHVSRALNPNAFRCRCEPVAARAMPAEEEPAAMESRETDGSPQQFCLRWNNYQSNLANCFDQLLQTESFVDVTLACEGQSLKAHKVVLSACSPYFQTLFMDNPCRHPIIIMRDIKYCDLKAVVDFMYRGEINVSQDQITALLKVAETLKIRGLTDVSGEHAVLRTGGVEARAPKRPVSRETESPAKSRRRASAERSPGPSPRRSPSTPAGAELVPPAEPASLVAPAVVPMHGDDVDIRPGIAEMIREEERVSRHTITTLLQPRAVTLRAALVKVFPPFAPVTPRPPFRPSAPSLRKTFHSVHIVLRN